MNRRIGVRLERLEQHIGTAPDLVREAAEHGGLIWSTAGMRAYARLAVVGGVGIVVYRVLGVSLEDLS